MPLVALRARVWSRAVGAVMGGGGSSAPAEQAEQPAVRGLGSSLFPRVFCGYGCGWVCWGFWFWSCSCV